MPPDVGAGQLSTAVATAAFAGLGLIGKACVVAGATAVGGCCVLTVRRFARVAVARGRLHQLLAECAGEDARIVITGATNGIGLELANQFRRHPAVSLLLGCRDMKLAARLFPEGVDGRVRVVHLELLDLDSVQSFTDEVHDFLRVGEPGLRLLVNNAGVMRPPGGLTASRLDPTWQTNFFSPFLLTELLARRRTTDRVKLPMRIVQVSSRLERRSELSEELLERVSRGEVGEHAYADSKRALMLWTSVRAQSLAFRGAAYTHCATPGMVDSQLGRHSVHPLLWPFTKPLRMLLLRSPAEGALAVAAAGLRPKAMETFGRYLDGETELEDLVLERMGEKQFANKVLKWATTATMLEQRADGYDR
mmetsp:Transcript_55510/g.180042  ORF Transcript_55510/g.180042 Transcript_55510/m.180042 type:complete len:364 (-) Transcript_55510:132-1223(-)